MKTYLSQNVCKKIGVVIFVSLMPIVVAIADNQSHCDPCEGQVTMSVAQPTVSSDSAGSATSINRSSSQLSNKELMQEYSKSLQGRIIGTVTNMMMIYTILALLCMTVITFVTIG